MNAAPTTARKIAIAARRVLDSEGADAVTMRRVAREVGITPMALYRHYSDREGLLNALADEGFEALAAQLESTGSSGSLDKRLTRVLDLYLDYALRHPRLFELMFLKPRAGARRFPQDFKAGASPTANRMAALIQEAMQTGHLRKDDPWAITFEMGALLQGLVMLYLGGRMAMSPARFRAFSRRSFRRYLHGIRN
jgi:AcrR family transcriptional regulator